MTFTKTVKGELLKIKYDKRCCRRAMLYGLLLFSYRFEYSQIRFSTENKECADKVQKLFSEFFPNIQCEFTEFHTSDRCDFRLDITEEEACSQILSAFGYAQGDTTYKILFSSFECDACRAAFLRGAFLSCASIMSPESAYHLEFVVSRFNLSRELLRLLKVCSFEGKYTKRNSHYIIYFKDNETIVDILALVGAVNCSFDMTNLIIEKDIRNNCNRVANCEAANIKRTVSTAQRQIDVIRAIIVSGKFSSLPEELQETARLRLENDDISLSILASLHNPPVTKSCVNHRLSKICSLYGKH